jgi:hypothetical protein
VEDYAVGDCRLLILAWCLAASPDSAAWAVEPETTEMIPAPPPTRTLPPPAFPSQMPPMSAPDTERRSAVLPDDDAFTDFGTPQPLTWWCWWNNCNGRGQHYAYLPPLPGWYYYRPYSVGQLRAQQEIAQRWGADPRNPYAVGVLRHRTAGIIRWPAALCDTQFQAQRERVEGQFHRDPKGVMVAPPDYRQVVEAAARMKSQVASTSNDAEAMAFLDHLTAEAKSRAGRQDAKAEIQEPRIAASQSSASVQATNPQPSTLTSAGPPPLAAPPSPPPAASAPLAIPQSEPERISSALTSSETTAAAGFEPGNPQQRLAASMLATAPLAPPPTAEAAATLPPAIQPAVPTQPGQLAAVPPAARTEQLVSSPATAKPPAVAPKRPPIAPAPSAVEPKQLAANPPAPDAKPATTARGAVRNERLQSAAAGAGSDGGDVTKAAERVAGPDNKNSVPESAASPPPPPETPAPTEAAGVAPPHFEPEKPPERISLQIDPLPANGPRSTPWPLESSRLDTGNAAVTATLAISEPRAHTDRNAIARADTPAAEPGDERSAAPKSRQKAATDIIKWPSCLRGPQFADQRARIEAPYRRDPNAVVDPSAEQYRAMIDAALEMKAGLAKAANDAAGSEFLDKLIAEARTRLPSAPQAAAAATAGPAAADLIKWPAGLRGAEFTAQRARIEAPYRRNGDPAPDDYQDMIAAAAEMKALIEETSKDRASREFLDRLAAEAKARLTAH